MIVQVSKLARSARLRVALLVAILVLAAIPRFLGVSWDGGYYAHPDESHIVDVALNRLQWPDNLSSLSDVQTSPMNPRRADDNGGHLSYSYGSLLVYGLKGVSNLVARVAGPDYADWSGVYKVARPLAALADLLTVLCVYLLGRRLYGTAVGMLAAAFSSLTVLQIQFSHFYVAEPIMTMLLTAALLQIVRATQDDNRRAVVYAGLLLGLAVGTKPSAAAFVPVGLLLLGIHGVRRARHSQPGSSSHVPRIKGALVAMVLAGACSLLAWSVVEPYAVLDVRTYVENIEAESRIQRGLIDVPFTRQYVGTIPGWYHLVQYVRWGAGIPLGLLVSAGLVLGVYRAVRRRDGRALVLLTWVAPYTVSILLLEAKWLRYMLPVTPVLLLLAAALLVHWKTHLCPSIGSHGSRDTTAGVHCHLSHLAGAAVLLGSLLWVLAWSRIYTSPHNWVEASRWLYKNVPAGSTIGHEHWDTSLPLALPGEQRDTLNYYRVDMYDDLEPQEKLLQVREALVASDYLVLASNRLSDSIPRSPWRYAVATRYYELLFEERLGFRRVAEFSHGPGLGPIEINEQGADDNVAVYDHPTATVFKKERDLESWELEALFADALAAPYSPQREGQAPRTLMLPPLRDLAATGLPYFQGSAGSGWSAVLLWLLALEALSIVGWLLFRGLLRSLPDGGWVLGRVLGLLILGWAAWIVPALGLWRSSVGLVWLLGLLLLCAAAVAALVQRDTLLLDLRSRWRVMLAFEGLFLALFGTGVLLRAANPDLWQPYFGGEKPMELAFINGILRSSELPPYDPWFADGYINYYYFGQWLVAILMRLSLVGPQYGFNLAVATMWALTGVLAASVGYSTARRLGRWSGVAVGALSLGLVLLVGNLDGAVQAVQMLRRDGQLQMWTGFDFWRSTRLCCGFVHEFPFFTYLYGDLHAHMLVMPLGLTLLLLGIALLLDTGDLRGSGVLLSSVTAGLLLGAIAVTNPWDAPAYGGLFLLALAAVWLQRSGTLRSRLFGAGASAAALVLVAGIAYLPFFRHFKSFYGAVGLVTDPTPLPEYLNMIGLFIYLAGWYAVVRTLSLRGGWLALAGALALLAVSVAQGRVVLGLLVGLLVLMLHAMWRVRRSPHELVWSGLAAGGLLLWAGVETLYLKDFLDGSDWYRMNTVFKFGLQSWILLALGCAGLVWLTVISFRGLLTRTVPLVLAVGLLSASLVYPVYGTASRLRQRFPDPPPSATLDGEAFLRTAALPNESGAALSFADDYAAIQWMRTHVSRPQTLVEASVGPYRGNGGRVSMFTGLPALVGWDNHEAQQRYPEQVAERHRDVRELYDSPDPQRALELISRYGVRYIYVGPVERLHEFPALEEGGTPQRYASSEGLRKFDGMVGTTLRVAYRNQGVTLYEVLPSWQWSGISAGS